MSKKMGLVTGPLMILLGLIGLFFKTDLKGLSIFIIIMGAVRLGMTLWLMNKEKQRNNEQQ